MRDLGYENIIGCGDKDGNRTIFKNGKHIGKLRTYYKSGKPQSVLNFKGLTETSDAEVFFENGNLKAKGKYIDVSYILI